MDRIDIQIDVPAVPYKELSNTRAAESSETIRMRVVAARNAQLRRFFDEKIYTNAQMGPRHLRKHCVLTAECEKIMENAVTKLGFSARGYDRILKRNRTTRRSDPHESNASTRTAALEKESTCPVYRLLGS